MRKCVTGLSGGQVRRYCCGAESVRSRATASYRSDARRVRSQHLPGDGRRRVGLASIPELPHFAPAPVPCPASALASQGGVELLTFGRLYRLTPGFGGFTPLPYTAWSAAFHVAGAAYHGDDI